MRPVGCKSRFTDWTNLLLLVGRRTVSAITFHRLAGLMFWLAHRRTVLFSTEAIVEEFAAFLALQRQKAFLACRFAC